MSSGLAVNEGFAGRGQICLLVASARDQGDNPVAAALRPLFAPADSREAAFRADLACLHADLLAAAGCDYLSLESPGDDWFASSSAASFRRRAVKLVSSHWAGTECGLIDDPLVGRLLPFWRAALQQAGITPALVAFVDSEDRCPDSFAESFGGAIAAGEAFWLARVLELEQASRDMARTHVTRAALRADEASVAQRMVRDLSIPALASAVFCRDGMAPSVKPVFPAGDFGRWVADVAATFDRWATSGEDKSGRDCLDGVAAAFAQVRPWLGMTVTAMGHEVLRQRAKVTELTRRFADLQRSGGGSDGARPVAGSAASVAQDDINQQLALIEARWAEIFETSRGEYEIMAEQNAVFCRSIADLSDAITQLESKLSTAEAEVKRLKLVKIAQQAEVKAARAENSSLRKNLAASRGSVAKLQDEARSREITLSELQDALLITRASEEARAAGASRESNLSDLFPKDLLLLFSPKARKKVRRHRVVRALVAGSGMFDAKFYAARYPDVIAAGADPLDHFIKDGGAEGRHPSLSFNSKWYLDENPDVKGVGLNPLVHYLEYGRDEGRRRRSLVETGATQIVSASAAPQARTSAPAAPLPEVKPEPTELVSTWSPAKQGWKGLLGLSARRREPVVPLGQIAERQDGRPLAIEGTVVAMLRNGEPISAGVNRVALFASLRAGSEGNVTLAGSPVSVGSAYALLSEAGFGIELLADGWHDAQNRLVLRFATGIAGVLRAFQIGADGAVTRIGEATLAGTESDLAEMQVHDPLGEILVVLSATDGALIDSLVLPFPSLLRGGLHHGELAVLETAPGSMVTLADYSRVLGLEWLGWPGGPEAYAVSRIEIDMRGANGTEPIFRAPVIAGLTTRFGLAIGTVAGSAAAQRDQLVASFSSVTPAPMAERSSAHGVLQVPCDTVPSLFAIVTRRLAHDPCITRLAIVDAATLKPCADLTIPQVGNQQPGQGLAALQHADLPAHAPVFVAADGVGADATGSPPFPLTVRHLNRLVWQGDPLMPVSPDQPLDLGTPPAKETVAVSAIIDGGSDADALAACIAALSQQIGAGRIEVVLAGWDDARKLPETAADAKVVAGAGLPRAVRLNLAAAAASGASLLFLDPAVLLSDPRTVAFLRHVAHQQGAATVACALVTEQEDGDEARVHSAGYFPARISLNSEPAFDVSQIDVARILPAATYPVAANHALCCLVDSAAWKALGGFDAARFPAAMFDLDFGVRAIAAGHTNLCTTLVRAATRQTLQAADFPDAIAQRLVRPSSWTTIFDRVTTIRELRR